MAPNTPAATGIDLRLRVEPGDILLQAGMNDVVQAAHELADSWLWERKAMGAVWVEGDIDKAVNEEIGGLRRH
jgi:hypothetical protein